MEQLDICTDFIFSDINNVFSPENKLLTAIQEHRYPTIYAHLRKRTEPFAPQDAFWLCYAAMKLNTKAFVSILEHCPPPEDFIHLNAPLPHIFGATCGHGLLEAAVYYDKHEVVKLLLEKGASPNAASPGDVSPLEAAMIGRSLSSLGLLLEHPDLDTTITERLLEVWAEVGLGNSPVLNWCCEMAAPRLLGIPDPRFSQVDDLSDWELPDPFGEEHTPPYRSAFEPYSCPNFAFSSFFDFIPLPEELTLCHAAKANNWSLFSRLCALRHNDVKDCLAALHMAVTYAPAQHLPAIVADLFRTCPLLLRRNYARFILVGCALTQEEGIPAVLQPWLEALPGKTVVIQDCTFNIELLLPRWKQHLEGRLKPALSLDHPLPFLMPGDKEITLFLNHCTIQGRRHPEKLSRLAHSLLTNASPALLFKLFQTSSFLSHEPPEALRAFCSEETTSQETRTAILANLKKEASYEL